MSTAIQPDSYADVLAEAAWVLRDDEQFTDAGGQLNGISDVSVFNLRKIGAHALADRYETVYRTGYLTWFRLHDRHVSIVEFGNDDGLRSGSDLVNDAFEKARAAAAG